MAIRLFNSYSHALEEFHPVEPGKVRMYNCGPTVYNYAHIGNFRSFLLADLLRRFLAFSGLEVKQVMNITDVGHLTEDHLEAGQDKVLVEAMRTGKGPAEVARFYEAAFIEDARRLRLLEPFARPRATDFVPRMIEMIAALLAKGYAYVVDGEVYYDVSRFPAYGRLSGNTLASLEENARVAFNEKKRRQHDFALWKRDDKHLMQWDAPWGRGFPGWHIECSAMSTHYLGDTLDLHTGGEDNIFPHHECEIAQSEAFTGKPFCRCWLHARYLLVDGRKMSKSLGNFHTVRDILEKGHAPEALRLSLLATHYRQNMNFTLAGLEESRARVASWQRVVDNLESAPAGPATPRVAAAAERSLAAFAQALADDLNISAALAAVDDFRRETNSAGPTRSDAPLVKDTMRRFDEVLALLSWDEKGLLDAEVEDLLRQRREARQARDFQRADAIRDRLKAAGILLEDTPAGLRWKRAR
ncbi:MAG: cysteine--tRNA ligase [Planctomycetes bacterium]|nr:cysteine--tRNA ligase [Planctomycetota bacterium]